MTIHGRKVKSNSERKFIIKDLITQQDKLRWDHPMTMKAFVVAREVKAWIASIVEEYPCVSVVVTECAVALMIGEICLWNSESDSLDELNLAFCKEQYKKEVLPLAAVLEL